jgi:hypothetical protein
VQAGQCRTPRGDLVRADRLDVERLAGRRPHDHRVEPAQRRLDRLHQRARGGGHRRGHGQPAPGESAHQLCHHGHLVAPARVLGHEAEEHPSLRCGHHKDVARAGAPVPRRPGRVTPGGRDRVRDRAAAGVVDAPAQRGELREAHHVRDRMTAA